MKRLFTHCWLLMSVFVGLTLTGCGLVDTIKARRLAREGNSLYQISNYQGAIEKYMEALKLDPEVPNLYLNLGYAYYSVYDSTTEPETKSQAAEQAVKYFDEHLKGFPLDEGVKKFQTEILLKAAPDNSHLADQALKVFLEMLHKNPEDKKAQQFLITLFIDCKRYEDAVNYFEKVLAKNPNDIETMKIMAIIADKSDRIQDAVDWYYKRAEITSADKKALLFYEVGTYAWNILYHQAGRIKGTDALKLADQGIQACRTAMKLQEKYVEAMVYANLLYLERGKQESDDLSKTWDSLIAFEIREEAKKIFEENKKKKEEEQKTNPETAGKGSGTGGKTEQTPRDTARAN